VLFSKEFGSRVAEYSPIGILHTCFTEKFGVPRQSMMVPSAWGILKLNPDPNYFAALGELDRFTHLWIIFDFHLHAPGQWRPTIEPPRLSQTKRVGVFASRSPHRPNPIGLSVVKLEKIDWYAPGGIEIQVSGLDIMDGTPVLDIKPYLPYADCIADAGSGWAEGEVEKYPVLFSAQSLQSLSVLGKQAHPRLRELIEQMLEWDPRPTSQRRSLPIGEPDTEARVFAFRVANVDVHWQVVGHTFHVLRITLAREQ
jgi:tRNA (adenine37-N6)-methyltransferase